MVTDRIEREIVVAAPAERLWEVLTRPEHIGRWFEGMDVELDLRPGGTMVLTSQEFGKFQAIVDQVEPPRLFAYRWARHPDTPVSEGTATRVEFTLTPPRRRLAHAVRCSTYRCRLPSRCRGTWSSAPRERAGAAAGRGGGRGLGGRRGVRRARRPDP